MTASAMRQHATTEELVMTRGTRSSACVLQDGKEPLVISVNITHHHREADAAANLRPPFFLLVWF